MLSDGGRRAEIQLSEGKPNLLALTFEHTDGRRAAQRCGKVVAAR